MKIHSLFKIIILFTLHAPLAAQGLIEALESAGKNFLSGSDTAKTLFASTQEEWQKQLKTLEDEHKHLVESEKSFNDSIQKKLDAINKHITEVNQALASEADDYEFLNKKLALLNEHYQVLKDMQQVREQEKNLIDQQIQVRKEYLQDPFFNRFKKEHRIGDKVYSFEDLQDLNQLIVEQGKNISSLIEQERNAVAEYESRKKGATGTVADLKKVAKQEEERVRKENVPDVRNHLTAVQRAELLRLETELLNDKKSLDNARLQEISHKISFIKTKLFIAKEQQEILKDELQRVKSAIKVRDTDVVFGKVELEKKRQESFATTEGYRQAVEKYTKERDAKNHELEELTKRFNITKGKELDEWGKQPRRTASAYLALSLVGATNEQVSFLRLKTEQLEALQLLEHEKLQQEKLRVDIKESFYKISARKFRTEEEITKEIKKYEAPKADIQANLLLVQEKKAHVIEYIAIKKRGLENLRKFMADIERQQFGIFRRFEKEYARSLALAKEAEESIKAQLDILNQLETVYTDLLTIITSQIKNVDFIITELGLITIWHRPAQAISWEGFKNIFSDIETFFLDIRSYIAQLSVRSVGSRIKDAFAAPLSTLGALLKLALFLCAAFVARAYLPQLCNRLLLTTGRWRRISLFFACLLGYVIRYFWLIFAWFFIFILLSLGIFSDLYAFVIFYLVSIPYMLYLVYCFMQYFVNFNMRQGYVLLSKSFQRRFVFACYAVLYSTVVIYFFRQAFMLSSYYKSELPTILLAINFIIFQIALISLIGKDQLLSIIPARPDFWVMVSDVVDRYYHLILFFVIAVIVMSNPYIGFGRLVWYLISGAVYTFILFRLLVFAYSYVRKWSSRLFFYTDEDEVVHERFAYAKTWYGFFIIASLLIFSAIALIIGLRIWGWAFGLDDVKEWLEAEIFPIAGNPITAISLLWIVAFILGGFFIAHAINRYVLKRIFELLLVDVGVQNTIVSITEYMIIIAAVLLGFYKAGLGSLVGILIGAILLSIGWVIKEPLSDFIAYFILLVQRPIKVGDYVKMDDDIKGVVRKITPRAVVIRKNNSHMVVVPNANVINRPVYNWNYVRNFIAFDDILVPVAFKEDPLRVKELLFSVVNANPNILKNPKPVIRLEEFRDYGYIFLVRGFLSSDLTLEQWEIASDVRLSIMKILREHNIEIASPVEVIRAVARGVKNNGDTRF